MTTAVTHTVAVATQRCVSSVTALKIFPSASMVVMVVMGGGVFEKSAPEAFDELLWLLWLLWVLPLFVDELWSERERRREKERERKRDGERKIDR